MKSASISDQKFAQKPFEKVKFKKGEIKRVSVVNPSEAVYEDVHYHENVGYLVCNGGVCCELIDPPKRTFALFVAIYDTKDDMSLVDNFDLEKNITVKPWVFKEKMFTNLHNFNKRYALDSRDISVECTNEDYQHLTLLPFEDSIYDKSKKVKEHVDKKIEELKPRLERLFGAKLSAEVIKEKFGMQEEIQVAGKTTTDVDVNSLVDDIV